MSKEEFELAYRRYMEDGGHSYDRWDISYAWSQYQKGADYSWLEKQS